MEFDKTLGPWLGRTMKMLDFHIQDMFSEKGIVLTKTQWIVLKKLKDKDGRAQQELAFITNRDKGSLTRLIHTLEKKELVERIPSKSDKRSNLIFLTEKGKEIFDETIPVMKNVLSVMQTDISMEEIEATIKVIKKVQQNLTNNNQKLQEEKSLFGDQAGTCLNKNNSL